jgi:hypothetical protein
MREQGCMMASQSWKDEINRIATQRDLGTEVARVVVIDVAAPANAIDTEEISCGDSSKAHCCEA